MKFWPAARRDWVRFQKPIIRSRSEDYNLTLIELRLDRNDEGEGSAALGVKIRYDKEENRIVLETASSEPIRLTKVTKLE